MTNVCFFGLFLFREVLIGLDSSLPPSFDEPTFASKLLSPSCPSDPEQIPCLKGIPSLDPFGNRFSFHTKNWPGWYLIPHQKSFNVKCLVHPSLIVPEQPKVLDHAEATLKHSFVQPYFLVLCERRASVLRYTGDENALCKESCAQPGSKVTLCQRVLVEDQFVL